MAYNIERACMIDPEQKTLGVEQVTQVLGTIIQLKNLIPAWLSVRQEWFSS